MKILLSKAEAKMTDDSTTPSVFLSEYPIKMDNYRNAKKGFGHLIPETRSDELKKHYDQCCSPPKLWELDKYRDDGLISMNFYSYPEFFVDEWKKLMEKDSEEKRKRKLAKKSKKKNSEKPSSNVNIANKSAMSLDGSGESDLRVSTNMKNISHMELNVSMERIAHLDEDYASNSVSNAIAAHPDTRFLESPLMETSSYPMPSKSTTDPLSLHTDASDVKYEESFPPPPSPPPPPPPELDTTEFDSYLVPSTPPPPPEDLDFPPPSPLSFDVLETYSDAPPSPPSSLPPNLSFSASSSLTQAPTPPPPPPPPPPPSLPHEQKSRIPPPPPPPPLLSTLPKSTSLPQSHAPTHPTPSNIASLLSQAPKLRPTPAREPLPTTLTHRDEVLSTIRQGGFRLRPVGQNSGRSKKSSVSSSTGSATNDVATILLRRAAIEMSDSEDEDEEEEMNPADEW
ncbi:hypothetical protein HMI56_002193 [Coelomomyces lativittatus]|nr:hypothetical protein HMI56_002193 [Coelomomyces lativittatus]